MSRNSPSGRTKAFPEAALCFEITASIAGLKKHIYSYITASEEISERGQEVGSTSAHTHTHTLPDVGHSEEECWEEFREDFGRAVQNSAVFWSLKFDTKSKTLVKGIIKSA